MPELRNAENLDSRLRGNDGNRRSGSWLGVNAIGIPRFLAHGCLIIGFALLLPAGSWAADKFTTIGID